MDFRRAPFRILLRQAPNQDTNFLGDPRPAAMRPRFPTPIKPKSSPMPTDDRFRLDNHEDFGPAGPKAAERGPEEPVTGVQRWTRSLALEDGDLLAESQNLQGSIGSGTKESAHGGPEGNKELHELTVVTWRNAMSIGRPGCPQQPIDFTI